MLAAAWHRVRQFSGALRPRVTDADRAEAYDYIDPPLQATFESMMLRDQQHGIIVLRRVRAAASSDDRALLTAALLHDCGKGRVTIWQRVLHVILTAAVPALARMLASERGAAWRRAFWRLREHPHLGAEIVAAAGADPDVVRLIREQDAPAPDARLAILQAADDA